jgi:hypothetical protein
VRSYSEISDSERDDMERLRGGAYLSGDYVTGDCRETKERADEAPDRDEAASIFVGRRVSLDNERG